MTNTLITTAFVAIVALTAVPAAFAAPPSDQQATFKVSTAGLDLNTHRGAQVMLRRIETAAGDLCGGAPYVGDLNAAHDYKVCVAHNVGQAVTQLASPMVAEINHAAVATQTASNSR
jgi:UrcA family protein